MSLDALGASIGGAFSFLGANSTNKANLKIAREQMAFQKEMSNTAHQREVQDLEAAGLNPLLSVSGSGASTPSGSFASQQNAIGEGINTALNTYRLMELEKKKTEADIKKTNAETDVVKSQNKILEPQVKKAGNENKIYDTWVGKNLIPWLNPVSQGLGAIGSLFNPVTAVINSASAMRNAKTAENALSARTFGGY